jgi:hypothetical protein
MKQITKLATPLNEHWSIVAYLDELQAKDNAVREPHKGWMCIKNKSGWRKFNNQRSTVCC